MWIFTQEGFISAVRKQDRPDEITIRARDARSLESIAALTDQKVASSPDGDYPYRVFVSPEFFADWLRDQALNIDYSNFKSRVTKTRGHDFVHALHRVWDAMHDVEDQKARPQWQ